MKKALFQPSMMYPLEMKMKSPRLEPRSLATGTSYLPLVHNFEVIRAKSWGPQVATSQFVIALSGGITI